MSRICVIAAQVPFTSGGAELHVDELVKNLRLRGFDAELVRLPYKWYPKESLYDAMMLARTVDLSEANGQKIDLVIPTKFPSYGVRHENKVPWVIHQFRQVYDLYSSPGGYRGTPEGREIRERVKRFDLAALIESRCIFSNSKNVAKRLRVYNGLVSVPLYHPPSLAGSYECDRFGDYILSVGRLDPFKRNDLLIRAISTCPAPVRAKIAGRGPEMERLCALAKSLGVEDRVDLLGFVDANELIRLYAGAFAVYFAPVDEDYGYITLEAFLSRKPVITCVDSGGPLEFVLDGVNGYILSPDPADIATGIGRLWADKGQCEQMGAAGYEAVRDISWNNVVMKLTKTL